MTDKTELRLKQLEAEVEKLFSIVQSTLGVLAANNAFSANLAQEYKKSIDQLKEQRKALERK